MGGQTALQTAINTSAPYAAQTIGSTFGENGSHPNTAAQLFGHAILGAVVAYANGGNTLAGATAGAGSEAAAIYLTKTLYPAAVNTDGSVDTSKLSEKEKENIRNLSSAVAAVGSGLTGGSLADAQTGGVVGRNTVENNWLSIADIKQLQRDLLNAEDEDAREKAFQQAAEKSQKNREQTAKNCIDKNSAACQNDIDNMVRAYNYSVDQNVFKKYYQNQNIQLLENNLADTASHSDSKYKHKQLPGLQVFGKQVDYEDRTDVRFIEYENLRDIADFASTPEDRKAIRTFLGEKDYRYSNQPWHEKPYGRMYILPTLQTGFGALAAGSGVAACTSGLGCGIGAFGVVAGADDIATGLRNFGVEPAKQHDGLRVQALQAFGATREQANLSIAALDIGSAVYGIGKASVKAGNLSFSHIREKKISPDIKSAWIENNFYRDGNVQHNWTSGKVQDIDLNIAMHWEKHQQEFPNLSSAYDYVRYINHFIEHPPKDVLMKTRANGDKLYYDELNNIFISTDKNNLPRTMFKPQNGIDYWKKQ